MCFTHVSTQCSVLSTAWLCSHANGWTLLGNALICLIQTKKAAKLNVKLDFLNVVVLSGGNRIILRMFAVLHITLVTVPVCRSWASYSMSSNKIERHISYYCFLWSSITVWTCEDVRSHCSLLTRCIVTTVCVLLHKRLYGLNKHGATCFVTFGRRLFLSLTSLEAQISCAKKSQKIFLRISQNVSPFFYL